MPKTLKPYFEAIGALKMVKLIPLVIMVELLVLWIVFGI